MAMKLNVSLSVMLGFVQLMTLPSSGCTPAEKVRPEDPSAASVLDRSGGGACSAVSNSGEPLVVDWEAHQRADLEEAMTDGVAVVAYNCQTLRLLRGCSVDGSYRFLAVSKKEELVKLENSDEISANLPGFGGALLQNFGADLERGSTLDVAMVLVGKKRTTVVGAAPGALRGGAACTGATHFVRGAFLGAFAMGIGTRGAAAANVGILFSAQSSSEKLSKYRDGQLDACAQVAPGSSDPPARCAATIRLELMALGATDPTPDDTRAREGEGGSCPAGMVLSAGKCARPAATATHTCLPGDVADCTQQCSHGDAPSCTSLGALYADGRGVPKDPQRALTLFRQGCDGGNANGCFDLALSYQHGAAGTEDLGQAAALYQRACNAGQAASCTNLGVIYERGRGAPQDFTRALGLYQQGCDGGNALGCTDVGLMYVNAKSVPQNYPRALSLLKNACDGAEPTGCANLGTLYENGQGVAPDLPRAASLYQRACDHGGAFGCKALGFLLANGKGMPPDYPRAIALYSQACNAGNAEGCSNLGAMHEKGLGTAPDRASAIERYRQGCKGGHRWGCDQLTRLGQSL